MNAPASSPSTLAVNHFCFESNKVRAITDEIGEPWFVTSDVCKVLQIANVGNATSRIPDSHKGIRSVDTLGGRQKVSVIDEPGLYRLILRSDKPQAEPFMEWVTSEVIPTIRKTGRYETPTEPTITPKQQNQIQQAIHSRFPEGKDLPCAWSRFNNHFEISSYKQLPGSRTEEALDYISTMPQEKLPQGERALAKRYYVFTYKQGIEVMVRIDEEGALWFHACDVLKAMGYLGECSSYSWMPKEGRTVRLMVSGYGRIPGEADFITSGDLKMIILRSGKHEKFAFVKWIDGVMLPALGQDWRICRHGDFAPTVAPQNAMILKNKNQMVMEGDESSSLLEQLFHGKLKKERFLMSFHSGMLAIEPIHNDAYVMPLYNLPESLANDILSDREREALPDIIKAAAKRLMETNK